MESNLGNNGAASGTGDCGETQKMVKRVAPPSGANDRRDAAQYLRREIATRLIQAVWRGDLVETIDRTPFEMRPKGSEAPYRCCIYKERAILRLRCLSALGFAVEDDDEFRPLSEYAKRALERTEPEPPTLTVADVACRGCVEGRYRSTNVCQGCLTRPCLVNCNFGAISVVDGKSVVDPSKCKGCGRCAAVCPYRAIVKVRVPCEEACPVAAIHKGADGRAEIDLARCVSCGRCARACPFGAVMDRSQIVDVAQLLGEARRRRIEAKVGNCQEGQNGQNGQNGEGSGEGQNGEKPQVRRLVALFAPALVGQFAGTLEQITAALLKLGFDDAIGVAAGADRTTVLEAEEFIERMKRGERFMTTSCCPAYVDVAAKHAPELTPFVSETATPARLTAEIAKGRDPNCVTVFIGPCVAKRVEASRDALLDYVLTFEELDAAFVAAKIDVSAVEPRQISAPASAEGRGFAVPGGVATAVETAVDALQTGVADADKITVQKICVAGFDSVGIRKLRTFATGVCPGNLVEAMACEGGCVGGPGTIRSAAVASREIKALVEHSQSIAERLVPAAVEQNDDANDPDSVVGG